MDKLKLWLFNFLYSNKVGREIISMLPGKKFSNSARYWENRYLNNGTSGKGSYGDNATYKAEILNKFVAENHIQKVLEFGCGDGNQLKLFQFPAYIGLDVSPTAIKKCSAIFKDDNTKTFFIYNRDLFTTQNQVYEADLVLSLDVVYHLIEDEVYENYMHHLFSSSSRFVIIYGWDVDDKKSFHVRHRGFTKWISLHHTNWHLAQKIESNSLQGFCDFFIYENGKKSAEHMFQEKIV